MVVVEFGYDEMKRMVDIPLEEMIEALSSLGAPCEYEPETKKIVAELTPNRPDWYSMEGLARALRAYYKEEHPKYTTRKSDYQVIVDPSVAEVRPYTVCAVVKGLEFSDQRIRDIVLLQEKLLATLGRRVKKFGIGIYPLHAIRFPIRYTTMRPEEIRYIPLGHEKEMGAAEILEEHKKGKQYGHLIKEHARYPVFVDAEGKLMALIPIVNSAETGKVDEKTKEVFIEVTGNSMDACNAALNIIVCTLADMGGNPHDVLMEYKGKKFRSPDLTERKMKIDLKEMGGVLGIALNEKTASSLLAKMGYRYGKGVVTVPPYRADIIHNVDIMEDIAIAYGYNNFEQTLPDFFSVGEKAEPYEEIDHIMRGMGFLEINTFILTNKEKLDRVGYGDGAIEISNPSTVDFTVVRPTLIADVLDVFSNNKMKGLPQKVYELGIVQDKGTKKKLIFGIMDKKVKFSDVRGYLQALVSEIGIGFSLEKRRIHLFDDDTSCIVVSKNKNIGILGKVKKEILDKFGLAFDLYICELDI